MYIIIILRLVRFAPSLKSNHNYNLSIMSDSTSEGKATSTVFKEQDEKKGKYQQRVLDFEMGSFIPSI